MRLKMILLLLLIMPFAIAGESGMNYYSTSQNNITVTEFNQTYDIKFMMDDIGTIQNLPIIIDINGDGINELVIPEYSGKMRIWNWTGLKKGVRESIDTVDRGTYILMSAMGDKIFNNDNDGNGCKEMAANDYYGYLRIFEYCNGTWTTILNDIDRGSYRSSPEWCDVDNDGDDDIFSCDYDGICILWTYNGTDYNINFTDSDRGTYHYGNSPTCGNWSNSAWGNGLVSSTYQGVNYMYDFVGGVFQMVTSTTDKGSIYGSSYVGEMVAGSGQNQIITPYTYGVTYAWNCSQSSCAEMGNTADKGSYSYGSSHYEMRTIDGQNYLFNSNSVNRPLITYMDNPSTITTDYIGNINVGGQSYIPIGLPKINSTNNFEYILYANRYFGDVASFKRTSGTSYESNLYKPNMQGEYYSRNYVNGFLQGAGFACGQLDTITEEDECFIMTYGGLPFMFTLQNITKFDMNYYDAYELALLDIMPRNAVQYLPEGETTTSCVNENENVFLDGVEGSNIISWITVKRGDGGSLTNVNRITDGILSTDVKFNSQNTVDYTSWENGADKSISINLTKIPELGMIKYYGYFSGQYDPLDLIIEISSETCTYPDTNIYTTIFNETGANSQDISGSATSKGLSVYFKPQQVGCLKITSSGSYYNQNTYSAGNFITEIEGFYANDCTFYHVPVDVRFADVSQSYNSTFEVEKSLKKNSPNQFGYYIGELTSWANNLLTVINRWIIRRA